VERKTQQVVCYASDQALRLIQPTTSVKPAIPADISETTSTHSMGAEVSLPAGLLSEGTGLMGGRATMVRWAAMNGGRRLLFGALELGKPEKWTNSP